MIPSDFLNPVSFQRGISPVAATDDTALVSQIIDMGDLLSLTFVIALGTLADAAFTTVVLLEESDDSAMSGATAVADDDMISMTSGTAAETAAAFTQASDDLIKTLGYKGTKRYVRLTITPTGNASSLPIAVIAAGVKRLQGTAN